MSNNLDVFAVIKEAQQKIPIDLEDLMYQLGISFEIDKNLPVNISGILTKHQSHNGGNKYKITVNGNDPLVRQRFTIAHELGHYVFHRDFIKTGVDDNRAYRASDTVKYTNYLKKHHEVEANRFASALLLPPKIVEEYQRNIPDIKELAQKFKVSELAMRIRLGLEK